MKRIFVIGNSQVASLKSGYELVEKKDFQISFFGIPGGGGPNINIDSEGNLILGEWAKENNFSDLKNDNINIHNFDIIFLSGVGLAALRKRNQGKLDFNLLKFIPSGFNLTRHNRNLISKDCYTSIMNNILLNLPCVKNIKLISSIFKKKIFVQFFPLPTEDVLDQVDNNIISDKESSSRFLSWHYQQQIAILKKTYSSEQIQFLDYPKDWILSGFTPSIYKTSDAWHHNKDFGKYIIEDFLSNLKI